MKKPTNNNFLGIMGETSAVLYNAKGEVIGFCMDTPNNIAYAFFANANVSKATGLLKTYSFEDVKDRFNTFTNPTDGCENIDIHKKYLKLL
jgi:predicted membrane chloride channel (bestrophin family)